ncbi:Uncharacterised protein [Candidatus Tiddalikarchaeum anstoanum]|nr:Uncharacterised protein [Candidatus Tiddalikarchaeum anstoanum]
MLKSQEESALERVLYTLSLDSDFSQAIRSSKSTEYLSENPYILLHSMPAFRESFFKVFLDQQYRIFSKGVDTNEADKDRNYAYHLLSRISNIEELAKMLKLELPKEYFEKRAMFCKETKTSMISLLFKESNLDTPNCSFGFESLFSGLKAIFEAANTAIPNLDDARKETYKLLIPRLEECISTNLARKNMFLQDIIAFSWEFTYLNHMLKYIGAKIDEKGMKLRNDVFIQVADDLKINQSKIEDIYRLSAIYNLFTKLIIQLKPDFNNAELKNAFSKLVSVEKNEVTYDCTSKFYQDLEILAENKFSLDTSLDDETNELLLGKVDNLKFIKQ